MHSSLSSTSLAAHVVQLPGAGAGVGIGIGSSGSFSAADGRSGGALDGALGGYGSRLSNDSDGGGAPFAFAAMAAAISAPGFAGTFSRAAGQGPGPGRSGP